MKGEYQKILYDIFAVLEFSDEEKAHALESIKKKLAYDLLMSLKGELPGEQQKWLDDNLKTADSSDPKVVEIQDTIQNTHSLDELREKSHNVFKQILVDYVTFMSRDLSYEKQSQLNAIVEGF